MTETGFVPVSTPDLQNELHSRLQDLLPSAFPDGVLDAGMLLRALGVSDSGSFFTFSWPGIEEARAHARAATTATLIPDMASSVDWDVARDILVEGDNLQVLKLLRAGYHQAVKLIYIDPPYNTGDTFTYRDDFAVPESEYLRSTGQVDDQGNLMTSKLEKAGKKHAPWLTMMFPRLAVARDLLRRDGVILVSIDNNEVHHLRLLLDAVFGPHNFVDMMTWQGGRKGDARLTAGGQDYILIYARDRKYLKDLDVRWRERKIGLEEVYAKEAELLELHGDDFTQAAKDLRKWYRDLPEGNPAKHHSHFDQLDSGGVWTSGDASSPNLRNNLIYEFEGYPAPANGWRYERSIMEELSKHGRLLYPEDKGGRVRIKRYLKEQETWAPGSVFYKERGAAQTALNTLMGAEVFDYPKNPEVLARLLDSMTEDGDLVIDFFAGSGATGQAVWEQNQGDGKKRHWILVQAPEEPDESTASGRNAIEQGYNTVFEITLERLRRTSNSIDGSPGFRVFRTRETNLNMEPPIVATQEMTGDDYVQASLLRAQRPPVVEGADSLSVAWEAVLKATSTRLDARVVERNVGDISLFEFVAAGSASDSGRLLVCLDPFSLADADAVALSAIDTVILRGDRVHDEVVLTLAPRLQSKLVLLERVPREVSL